MNTIYNTIIIALIVVTTNMNSDAYNLKTDAVCISLKKALEQAQPCQTVQTSWTTILNTGISKSTSEQLANQIIEYAQEQKTMLEERLAALQNSTHDNYKLRLGALKLLIGCIINTTTTMHLRPSTLLSLLIRYNIVIDCSLYPLDLSDDAVMIPDYRIRILNNTFKNAQYGSTALWLFIQLIGFGLGCTGFWNINQGYNYRHYLETKIEHLTQIIAYMQSFTKPGSIISASLYT